MCLHKHTIVHQHLYNIKGVIYKSTGIIHRVLAQVPHPPVLCIFPIQEGPALGKTDKAQGIRL